MSGPLTPEGIEVVVGQKWRDLDKRMQNRVCVVVRVDSAGETVYLKNPKLPGKQPTQVAIRRLKKGSTGWALE